MRFGRGSFCSVCEPLSSSTRSWRAFQSVYAGWKHEARGTKRTRTRSLQPPRTGYKVKRQHNCCYKRDCVPASDSPQVSCLFEKVYRLGANTFANLLIHAKRALSTATKQTGAANFVFVGIILAPRRKGASHKHRDETLARSVTLIGLRTARPQGATGAVRRAHFSACVNWPSGNVFRETSRLVLSAKTRGPRKGFLGPKARF